MVKGAIQRWPTDDDELWEFMATIWGFEIPRVAVCDGHCAPFTAFADAYFARSPIAIWKASRGLGGKSELLGHLSITEAVTLAGNISVLGGSASQSQTVHAATTRAWYSSLSPRYMLAKDPTQYYTHLTNGAVIKALMASQTSVRGPHPLRLRMDEIDEMDLDILEAAQGQPMDVTRRVYDDVDGVFRYETVHAAQTVMSSTHQYPDRTMTAMLKRARASGWPVYEWCINGDALVQTSRGEIPLIEMASCRGCGADVDPGEKCLWCGEPNDILALTRGGYRSVQHVTYMGDKPVLVIELSNGRTIRATPDHKFATSDGGWVRADEILLGTTSLVGLSPADAAVPSSIGAGVGVLSAVGVTAGAFSTSDLISNVRGSDHVGSMSDVFEMAGADAMTDTTEVVKLIADVALPSTVREPVSHLLSPLIPAGVHLPVAVGIGLAGPKPARALVASVFDDDSALDVSLDSVHAVSIHTGATIPVYDVGVHGQHEFVAEGVVVHNCYRESMGTHKQPGWLTSEQVARKRAEITDAMWATEYDLQEPSFEGRAIDVKKVEWTFNVAMGEVPGDENIDYIFEKPTDTNSLYVTGVDWAKQQDWTIVATFRTDVIPWRCVAWRRTGRRPWPVLVGYVESRMDMYGGYLIHDNTGLGTVVGDLISYDKKLVDDFTMVGARRTEMFNEYIVAIESGGIQYPRIEYAFNEHKYVVLDDLYGRGHPPDSVVAGALAWSARLKVKKRSALGIMPTSVERETSPWKA